MATLRAAPTKQESPWYLKKEGPANRGEMEPTTPTTPSTKLQQLLKKQGTLTKGMQPTVKTTSLTALHAHDNSVLDLATMLKVLWITNGTPECHRT